MQLNQDDGERAPAHSSSVFGAKLFDVLIISIDFC